MAALPLNGGGGAEWGSDGTDWSTWRTWESGSSTMESPSPRTQVLSALRTASAEERERAAAARRTTADLHEEIEGLEQRLGNFNRAMAQLREEKLLADSTLGQVVLARDQAVRRANEAELRTQRMGDVAARAERSLRQAEKEVDDLVARNGELHRDLANAGAVRGSGPRAARRGAVHEAIDLALKRAATLELLLELQERGIEVDHHICLDA
jgi:chromosome segregation ATPase